MICPYHFGPWHKLWVILLLFPLIQYCLERRCWATAVITFGHMLSRAREVLRCCHKYGKDNAKWSHRNYTTVQLKISVILYLTYSDSASNFSSKSKIVLALAVQILILEQYREDYKTCELRVFKKNEKSFLIFFCFWNKLWWPLALPTTSSNCLNYINVTVRAWPHLT